MKIVICASITATPKMKEVSDFLTAHGHSTEVPFTTKRILSGELSMEEFLKIKNTEGDIGFRKNANEDLIKRYYNLIKESDAILVLNVDKNGIKNYIGGNTLMEMGFAYILGKKIFLYNQVPEMSYADEIKAVQPILIDGDLSKIN